MVDVKWKMGNGISNFEFRISNLVAAAGRAWSLSIEWI